ncbi:MAG: C40 family peptidase [Acidimicrobiales bacterium]|nr:C40 family peptidase [Acidimicrobiales bacterium]
MGESKLGSYIAWAAGALVLCVVLVAGAAGAAVSALLPGGGNLPIPLPLAGPLGALGSMLSVYQQADGVCPGMSWTVLAAIGTVESANGTSTLPGVHSGANPAGAEGPMQMEPATFAAYQYPVPPGGVNPPNPYDPLDAVYAAARDLCANGANTPGGVAHAVFVYNHSDAYVAQVLNLAAGFEHADAQLVSTTTAGGVAVDWAVAQVGIPYIWGGEDPGVGFDCSGLVQAGYHAAGIDLPRTAQAQYDGGPQLPAGVPLLPGDLVFFGTGPQDVTHVGLVIAQGQMVDAPHTGAAVRVEALPDRVGALWGTDEVVGFTRPAS